MKKAVQKTSPVSLGKKRICPDCSTKFYDFNKEELACPKCDAKIDPNSASQGARSNEKKPIKATPKAVPEEALMESEDLVVAGSEEAFESVEDLDDEEDDLVEDLDVDEEEGGGY